MKYIIAAKLESKRLGNKNVMPIYGGRSSLQIVNEEVHRSAPFQNTVYVATDTEEMARHTNLPLIVDDDEIRGQEVGLVEVLRRACLHLGMSSGDSVCLLWGNNPLLRADTIFKMRTTFELGKIPILQTFSVHHRPVTDTWVRSVVNNEMYFVDRLGTKNVGEQMYYVNGGVRFQTISSLYNDKNTPVTGYIVPPTESWEVDTFEDAMICRHILAGRKELEL